MAITQGFHHVGLTVPNINATRDFFVDVLEFKQVGEVPNYPAYFLSDGTHLLTLWQAVDPDKAISFDRKTNIGLHHFAFKVDSVETLNTVYEKLKTTEGVEIEFAPELLGGGPTQHMMFYIPGGIRMELTAPAK
ncbi:VOC family protein [Almyronema epifaneia]|uniref:VOC family protein n=1 Tax=Almyronema epifaneia S1 TaxID=2991925 RepID=A0ABW6IEL8_9CYAN